MIQLKRATSAWTHLFEECFWKPSLKSCFQHWFFKNRCHKVFSKMVLRKPSLKNYNYLQKYHRFTYDIDFCKTSVVKDLFSSSVHFFSPSSVVHLQHTTLTILLSYPSYPLHGKRKIEHYSHHYFIFFSYELMLY